MKEQKLSSNNNFFYSLIHRIIAILMLLSISGCLQENCIEADDFGFPNVKVPVFKNTQDISGVNEGQFVPWIDSGYTLDGSTLVIVVKNWTYGQQSNSSDALSAWSPWYSFGKDSGILPVMVERFPTCKFTNAKGIVNYKVVNPPCLMKEGKGLYAAISSKDYDINGSDSSKQFPDANQAIALHLGETNTPSLQDLDVNGDLVNAGGLIFDVENNSSDKPFLKKGSKLYFKILDSYYQDNAGQYIVKIKSGINTSSSDPIQTIVNLVKNVLFGETKTSSTLTSDNDSIGNKEYFSSSSVTESGIIFSIFNNITRNKSFQNSVKALLTLYISFVGLGFTMGFIKINAQDLIKRYFKIAILSILISENSWFFFQQYFFTFFIDGGQQIINIIQGAGNTGGGSNNILTLMLAPQTLVKLFSLLFVSWDGFIYIILYFICFCFLFVTIVKAYIVYLNALILMGIVITTGPIFLCFMLFKSTEAFFKNWVQQLVSYTMQPIILFTGITFMSILVRHQIYTTLGFKVCKIEFPKLDDDIKKVMITNDSVLKTSFLYWWIPKPDKITNPTLTDVLVPEAHYQSIASLNKPTSSQVCVGNPDYATSFFLPTSKNPYCKAYQCTEKRISAFPYLDPNIPQDCDRLNKIYSQGTVRQNYSDLLLLAVLIWLISQFNKVAVNIATGISGGLNFGKPPSVDTYKAANEAYKSTLGKAIDRTIGSGLRSAYNNTIRPVISYTKDLANKLYDKSLGRAVRGVKNVAGNMARTAYNSTFGAIGAAIKNQKIRNQTKSALEKIQKINKQVKEYKGLQASLSDKFTNSFKDIHGKSPDSKKLLDALAKKTTLRSKETGVKMRGGVLKRLGNNDLLGKTRLLSNEVALAAYGKKFSQLSADEHKKVKDFVNDNLAQMKKLKTDKKFSSYKNAFAKENKILREMIASKEDYLTINGDAKKQLKPLLKPLLKDLLPSLVKARATDLTQGLRKQKLNDLTKELFSKYENLSSRQKKEIDEKFKKQYASEPEESSDRKDAFVKQYAETLRFEDLPSSEKRKIKDLYKEVFAQKPKEPIDKLSDKLFDDLTASKEKLLDDFARKITDKISANYSDLDPSDAKKVDAEFKLHFGEKESDRLKYQLAQIKYGQSYAQLDVGKKHELDLMETKGLKYYYDQLNSATKAKIDDKSYENKNFEDKIDEAQKLRAFKEDYAARYRELEKSKAQDTSFLGPRNVNMDEYVFSDSRFRTEKEKVFDEEFTQELKRLNKQITSLEPGVVSQMLGNMHQNQEQILQLEREKLGYDIYAQLSKDKVILGSRYMSEDITRDLAEQKLKLLDEKYRQTLEQDKYLKDNPTYLSRLEELSTKREAYAQNDSSGIASQQEAMAKIQETQKEFERISSLVEFNKQRKDQVDEIFSQYRKKLTAKHQDLAEKQNVKSESAPIKEAIRNEDVEFSGVADRTSVPELLTKDTRSILPFFLKAAYDQNTEDVKMVNRSLSKALDYATSSFVLVGKGVGLAGKALEIYLKSIPKIVAILDNVADYLTNPDRSPEEFAKEILQNKEVAEFLKDPETVLRKWQDSFQQSFKFLDDPSNLANKASAEAEKLYNSILKRFKQAPKERISELDPESQKIVEQFRVVKSLDTEKADLLPLQRVQFTEQTDQIIIKSVLDQRAEIIKQVYKQLTAKHQDLAKRKGVKSQSIPITEDVKKEKIEFSEITEAVDRALRLAVINPNLAQSDGLVDYVDTEKARVIKTLAEFKTPQKPISPLALSESSKSSVDIEESEKNKLLPMSGESVLSALSRVKILQKEIDALEALRRILPEKQDTAKILQLEKEKLNYTLYLDVGTNPIFLGLKEDRAKSNFLETKSQEILKQGKFLEKEQIYLSRLEELGGKMQLYLSLSVDDKKTFPKGLLPEIEKTQEEFVEISALVEFNKQLKDQTDEILGQYRASIIPKSFDVVKPTTQEIAQLDSTSLLTKDLQILTQTSVSDGEELFVLKAASREKDPQLGFTKPNEILQVIPNSEEQLSPQSQEVISEQQSFGIKPQYTQELQKSKRLDTISDLRAFIVDQRAEMIAEISGELQQYYSEEYRKRSMSQEYKVEEAQQGFVNSSTALSSTLEDRNLEEIDTRKSGANILVHIAGLDERKPVTQEEIIAAVEKIHQKVEKQQEFIEQIQSAIEASVIDSGKPENTSISTILDGDSKSSLQPTDSQTIRRTIKPFPLLSKPQQVFKKAQKQESTDDS